MALGHSAFAEAPIASAAGVSATVAVSGLSLTSALGSLTLSGTSNLTLPSQSATTAVGSPNVFVNAIALLEDYLLQCLLELLLQREQV